MREFIGIAGFLMLLGAAGTDQLQASAGFHGETVAFSSLILIGVIGLGLMFVAVYPEKRGGRWEE